MYVYVINKYEASKKQTYTLATFATLELANTYIDCIIATSKECAIHKNCFKCVQVKENELRNRATVDDDEMWIERVPYMK